MYTTTRTITELHMDAEDQRIFKRAMELAWALGQEEDFDEMPANIRNLIYNIADNIEELLDYIPDEH